MANGKSNQLGTLGELKAISEFIKLDFNIYVPLSGKEPYDFIACKENKLIKVQVKSTSCKTKNNSYEIGIKSVRSNRTTNIIKRFKPSQCDILATYIQPLDKICFIKASAVTSGGCITFRESFSNYNRNEQKLISDYTDLSKIV